MNEMGKMLIVVGVGLVLVGVVVSLLGRWNLPLGSLPGDILYRGKRTTFYFPLATSVVVSVVLSVVMYLIGKWRKSTAGAAWRSQNPHPFDKLRAGSLAQNARRVGYPRDNLTSSSFSR